MSHLLWYPGHELLLKDIVRAEGCSLYDGRGKRYVDLESGVWCASIGHGHPRMRQAIHEQADRIAHCGFNYSNEVVEKTARLLLSLVGFDGGRCVLLCSGSEAIEYGVRVAQMLLERPLLLTMADSYFGAYGSASRRSEGEWAAFDWSGCSSCSRSEMCDAECPRLSALPFDRIGGFLLEPGSSSGLVRFPPKGLVSRIVDRVGAEGGLILVNEVTTGMGRTGEWFGYQHYRIDPDIVAVGKGVGSGYPVSAALFGPRVVDRLADRPVKYALSHLNDPLGAAVAAAVISVIREEKLLERSRRIGAKLTAGLERIRSLGGPIREIRGRGAMIAVELEGRAVDFTGRVHRSLMDRGFIVGRRPGVDVLRLDPPLILPDEDLDRFLTGFEEVLSSER